MPKTLTKRGRRPGTTATRDTIQTHAAELFARLGYDGVTVREIARASGVDAALVHHFFRTKKALFEEALALHEGVDVTPNRTERQAARGDGKGSLSGDAIVREFLARWDAPGARARLGGLMRSSNTDADARETFVAILASAIVAPSAAAIDPRRGMSRLRANLIAAQLVGLAWLRYVLVVEPIASASAQILVKIFGPSVEATLRGTDFGGPAA